MESTTRPLIGAEPIPRDNRGVFQTPVPAPMFFEASRVVTPEAQATEDRQEHQGKSTLSFPSDNNPEFSVSPTCVDCSRSFSQLREESHPLKQGLKLSPYSIDIPTPATCLGLQAPPRRLAYGTEEYPLSLPMLPNFSEIPPDGLADPTPLHKIPYIDDWSKISDEEICFLCDLY